MAAIISALDKMVPTNLGENDHSQYAPASNENYTEKIVQFNFQCTRNETRNETRTTGPLSSILRGLLQSLSVPKRNPVEETDRKTNLGLLYAMIGYTRDIIDGKGEYTLAYMMIMTWFEFFPDLAVFAVKTFVDESIHTSETHASETHTSEKDPSTHPYGSWKDIKYLCAYVRDHTKNARHPIILAAVRIMNDQLRQDTIQTDNSKLSLAGKWTARQGNAKFGWLFPILAEQYFPQYAESAKHQPAEKRTESLRKAGLKGKTDYRKLCSALNARLDTIQIKQCANIWAKIDHSKTTSITVSKQKKALLNVVKKGTEQRSEDPDRVQCAENFKEYIDTLKKEGKEVKGARVGMADFTKTGISLISQRSQVHHAIPESLRLEIDILNSQWRDNSKLTGALGNMIAMVDTSGSMDGDPLHVALALGIRIAEKSALGKRFMTFNVAPTWVSLEGDNTFLEMLKTSSHTSWGMNTNFYAALNLIATAIRLSPTVTVDDCQNMVLVILSDMQMDAGDNSWKSVYSGIEAVYAELGIRKFGVSIRPPHILFWNLRSTDGFPSLSSQANVSMMSGFSPAILNVFCEKGMEALQACTPWSLLKETLNKPRYDPMRTKARVTV